MVKKITVNIPFTYTVGEIGFFTRKRLKTNEDFKEEVRAEIEAGVLSEYQVFMRVDTHDTEEPLQGVWDFVEKYYPNYYTCDKIALNDDLAKLVEDSNEEGSDAHILLFEEYGNDIENPEILQDFKASCADIYEDAIKGYIEALTK